MDEIREVKEAGDFGWDYKTIYCIVGHITDQETAEVSYADVNEWMGKYKDKHDKNMNIRTLEVSVEKNLNIEPLFSEMPLWLWKRRVAMNERLQTWDVPDFNP